MAFPTLVDQTDSDTSGTGQVPDLGSYTTENLLVCFHIRPNTTAFSAPGNGWSELWQGTLGGSRGGLYAKVSTGTDTLTITGGNANGASVVDEWSGHGGLPEVATAGPTTSSNSDPPNLAPSWGAKDTAWIAARWGHSSPQASAAPASFSNLHLQQPSSGDGRLATAERNLNASSLNPGTFTSASAEWVTATLAIPPATAIAVGLGLVTETGTVNPLSVQKTKTLGNITETATVNPVKATKGVTLGSIAEATSLFPVDVDTSGTSLGLITETTALFPLNVTDQVTLGLVTETSTLFTVDEDSAISLALITETSTVNALSVARSFGSLNLAATAEVDEFLLAAVSIISHLAGRPDGDDSPAATVDVAHLAGSID